MYVQKRRTNPKRTGQTFVEKISAEYQQRGSNRVVEAKERKNVWDSTRVEGDPWELRFTPEQRALRAQKGKK